jgi:hypothetical protein
MCPSSKSPKSKLRSKARTTLANLPDALDFETPLQRLVGEHSERFDQRPVMPAVPITMSGRAKELALMAKTDFEKANNLGLAPEPFDPNAVAKRRSI